MFEIDHNQKEIKEQKQTFTDFMRNFLDSKSAKTVVEIGSDPQLKIALDLSDHCKEIVSVCFKKDHERIQSSYESWSVSNLKLKSGNALNLSKLVPKADVIILHNVVLEPTGNESVLLGKYSRKEVEYTKEDWNKQVEKIKKAEIDGYKEFMKVAKSGYIVTFNRKAFEEQKDSLFRDKLKINPDKIQKVNLLYEEDDPKEWVLHIIDNT